MDNKKKNVTINKEQFELELNSIKEELGRAYNNALTWYHIMHPYTKKMHLEDYHQMVHEWKLCNAVASMIETDGDLSTVSVAEEYLDRTYRFFMKLYNGDVTVKRSDDEKRSYIADCMESFKRETTTETLHKKSTSLLKMSYEDIEFVNGEIYFDSRKASVFIGGNISNSKFTKTMRWVGSAEDGISRILEEHGLSQVICFLGNQGNTPEENQKLLDSKEMIFLKGITDVATGKHYLCSAPSASSTRHADFPFIEASCPADVYKIWCEVTGFKTIEDLIAGIGSFKDGKYIVNLAKLKARIAMRGSNSLDTYKLTSNSNVLWKLQHPNVDYVRDSKGTTSVPYKHITVPGVLEMKNPDGSNTIERV